MARRRFLTVISGLIACVGLLSAQTFNDAVNRITSDFNKAKQDMEDSFNEYVNRRQALFDAYTESMKQEWQRAVDNAALSMPLRPEPKQQPVCPPDAVKQKYVMPVQEEESTTEAFTRRADFSLDDEIPDGKLDEMVERLKKKETPQPEPEEEPNTKVAAGDHPDAYTFFFHHTECRVRMGKDFAFKLESVDENCCLEAWQKLVRAKIDPLQEDCRALRESMRLSDWGYVELLRILGQSYYNHTDKATLFMFTMLLNDDYKVRLCLKDRRVVLMANMEDTIYRYTFINMDEGSRYYLLVQGKPSSCVILPAPKGLEGTKMFSVMHPDRPCLAYKAVEGKEMKLKGEDDEVFNLQLMVNGNLMEYYNSYPQSKNWRAYVYASLSREVKRALYPFLKKQLADKSEEDAVNYLMHFLHSFDYQTDGEQFGYERAFFGDESFYYKYNDCEDRAILLAILVRDLLGLQTVLLEYGGHVSTGVRFSEDIGGYGYKLADGLYTSCDPTYIGSVAGMCMTKYKGKQPKIARL